MTPDKLNEAIEKLDGQYGEFTQTVVDAAKAYAAANKKLEVAFNFMKFAEPYLEDCCEGDGRISFDKWFKKYTQFLDHIGGDDKDDFYEPDYEDHTGEL